MRDGAGIAMVSDRAFLRVTGSDATRWLNGMVTNSIQGLLPGEGNYNFLLSAQGRIQGDCNIFREPGEQPVFLLHTSADQMEAIQALLEKFIIMDDVELARACEREDGILLIGQGAPKLLLKLGLPEIQPNHSLRSSVGGDGVILLAPPSQTMPHVEIWSTTNLIAEKREHLLALGAQPLSAADLDALRIFAGVPRYSIDIRDRDLPQETNQPHALHFAKGCYLGQEIVERIRSRGQVHRLFTPLMLHGTQPSLPAPLEANGKPAGEVTSVAQIGEDIYALGYVRREALELKQQLTYSGGQAYPRTIASPQRIQDNEKPNG